MAGTKGCNPARGSESHKAGLSSDCSLQLDCMKLESLVIVYQQRHGEYVPGPYTPPVTPWKPGVPEVRDLTLGKERPKANSVTGAKS